MLDRHAARIAKLKAAMWESRNIERLISKAVRSYVDPDSSNQVKKDIHLTIGDSKDKKEILVKGVPHIVQGGEAYENIHLLATIEQILEEEFQSLPNSICFDELLK